MTPTMKMMRLLLLVTFVSLTGCFSLAREEPTQQHFVLGGSDMPETMSRVEGLSGLRIGFRQLKMAEYLNSPLIVVRQGSHQIHYSEFNRWGGDLDSGVERAVAGYLTALAPLGGVDIAPWDTRATHDYLIQVHLLRLEGQANRDPVVTLGKAHMLAQWEIIHPQEGTVLARGTTDYTAEGWIVDDYGNLVDGLDRSLWQLAHDLVSALMELDDAN